MLGILEALLAVPPALDACRNLTSAWLGRSPGEPDRDAQQLHTKLVEITENLVKFSDFSETVRRWKELHNVTQSVLSSDLTATIAIYLRGSEDFADTIAGDPQ